MSKEKLRPWALKETDYNEEKARIYRQTFHTRDAEWRTWNEHIYAWRREHPERYREQARLHVAKSKLIDRLGVKALLQGWGLPAEQISRFLRHVSLEEVTCVVDCLTNWDQITGRAAHTPSALLLLVHRQHSRSISCIQVSKEEVIGAPTEVRAELL
jgi:hypothetical protein